MLPGPLDQLQTARDHDRDWRIARALRHERDMARLRAVYRSVEQIREWLLYSLQIIAAGWIALSLLLHLVSQHWPFVFAMALFAVAWLQYGFFGTVLRALDVAIERRKQRGEREGVSAAEAP